MTVRHKYVYISTAITVQLTQQSYTIAEVIGVAQAELIFSNPSYTDINVTVSTVQNDATGQLTFLCV